MAKVKLEQRLALARREKIELGFIWMFVVLAIIGFFSVLLRGSQVPTGLVIVNMASTTSVWLWLVLVASIIAVAVLLNLRRR